MYHSPVSWTPMKNMKRIMQLVYVIDTIVGIENVIAVNSIGSSKIRRTVVIEDEEGERINLIFWDTWAKKWNAYAENTAAVHNALFRTKLYINRELYELLSFRQSYKMIVRVMDESGSTQLFIFDGNMYKMSGFTAWEMVKKYGTDTTTYFHDELNCIIRKKFLFRVLLFEYNHNNNSHVYRCEKVTQDEKIVKYWKQGFFKDEPYTRAQLTSPASCDIGSSSAHSSGSKKKRAHTIKKSIAVIDFSNSKNMTRKMTTKSPMQKKPMLAVDEEPSGQKAIVYVKVEKDIEKDEEPK
ncbi:replication protein A 70 kDa DNA-binding subunit B [Tanacetum coccineum]